MKIFKESNHETKRMRRKNKNNFLWKYNERFFSCKCLQITAEVDVLPIYSMDVEAVKITLFHDKYIF